MARESNLEKKLDLINARLGRIEESLSRVSFIRSKWIKLTYSHRDKELRFNSGFAIKFDKNEAELLDTLFVKKTGKPKLKTFYCQELAEYFKKVNSGPMTAKAVHQTVERIDKKVKHKTKLSILDIKTKEFHFYN